MKTSCSLLLLAVVAAVPCSPAKAQFGPHSRQPALDLPFALGGYALFGVQSPNPGDSAYNGTVSAGLYGELNRGPFHPEHLHPGLDLRGTFTGSNVGGTLVGPRLGVSYSALHPYAEFLFGPNHVKRGDASLEGVNSSFVAGLDVDYGTNIRWRVLEYSQGFFTGIPGSRPRTLSSGFVIVFP